ncbi:glycosyltransferase [Xylophilus rhododendri]|uniref:Glycosyltransferase n=1 Tax=Xylophilus rhododendri TaxID=2697032 RepID=A0A857JAJ3_9BURK|nr:glycosyltransferase family 2 protein [Xylophilus rhododendri]QHJ00162.1 glycosyltransferase [Xylophilus rhododendri]
MGESKKMELMSTVALETSEEPLTISVVMPVKDRFDLAEISIRAVLNQTSAITQIIIVDDSSAVPVEEYFSALIKDIRTKGVEVICLRNELNQGVSASRNRGVQCSTGAVVCFCDSDDFWIPHKVAHVRHVFMEPEVILHYHAFTWFCGTLKIFSILPRARLQRLPKALMVIFSFLNPSCLSIRREAFAEGFDESMRYHEDLDFVLRKSLQIPVHFSNFPLMIMGRPPGSQGGATENGRAMRLGAIDALARYRGKGLLRFIANAKQGFHRRKLR